LTLLESKPTIILTLSRSHWLNWWPYPVLKKLFNFKYIVIIHGGGLSEWKWKYPFLKLFEKADQVIGISKRICEVYHNRTGVNVIQMLPLIPFEKSTVNTEKLKEKWGYKKDETIFLSVGSIKPLKNPGIVISAAKILGLDFLNKNRIKFVFAGDGVLLPQIKIHVAKLNLESRFHFLGNISRDLISEVYGASDVYMINSDFEGTPLSLLEAMHNELSIIAANSPGINDVITHDFNGLLYKTKDAEELAKAIKKSLITNDLLIKNSTQTLKESFNYIEMIKEYKLIFNK